MCLVHFGGDARLVRCRLTGVVGVHGLRLRGLIVSFCFIFGQVEGDGVGVGPMGFYCRERQFAKHQHDEHFCVRGRCHHGQPSPPQSRCVCRAPGSSVGFERAARLVEGTFGTVRCVCGQVLVVVLGRRGLSVPMKKNKPEDLWESNSI